MNVLKFEARSYTKCISSDDFYKAVGLAPYITTQIHSVEQMRINPQTYDSILETMCGNYKQDNRLKNLLPRRAKARISFDWMCYAPILDKKVPENEIWWEPSQQDEYGESGNKLIGLESKIKVGQK